MKLVLKKNMVHLIQKHQIITILLDSFAGNERINSMLRSKHRKHLKTFFIYIYTLIEQIGQIYIAKNQSTVLLYYLRSNQKHNLATLRASWRLLLYGISWKNLYRTIRTKQVVSKTRDKAAELNNDLDYIYVWFMAGKERQSSYTGLYEAMTHLKKQCLLTNLPIYIETTVARLLPIYKRAGFKFYDNIKIGHQTIWFAKFESYAA